MIVTGTRQDIFNVTFDGNSICSGQGVTTAQRYSSLLLADSAFTPYLCSVQRNIGVGGQTTTDMTSRQSEFLFPLLETRLSRNLVIAMEVRNDLMGGTTDATALANIKTYCQNCINAGFDVILVNQTPSTGGTPTGRTQGEMETSRQWVRSQILADFPNATNQALVYTPNSGITYATLVCDVGGDSVMGDVANCGGANYQDGTHPTAAGHSLIAAIIKRAIQYYQTMQR